MDGFNSSIGGRLMGVMEEFIPGGLSVLYQGEFESEACIFGIIRVRCWESECRQPIILISVLKVAPN